MTTDESAALAAPAAPVNARFDELHPLEEGPALPFAAWPGDPPIPMAVRGVYTLWKGDRLLYVGLAGLGELPAKKPRKPWGLHRRLAAHAAGRRAQDQVNCHLADRFVLDTLDEDHIDAIIAGERTMDQHLKSWIDAHLTYRYVQVSTTAVARDLEQRIRRGELHCGPPFLNPLRTHSEPPTPPSQHDAPEASQDAGGGA